MKMISKYVSKLYKKVGNFNLYLTMHEGEPDVKWLETEIGEIIRLVLMVEREIRGSVS